MLIVEQLLDKGADINFVNKEGESALFYAARRNQPAIARLLLQRGANSNIRDSYGDTAIDHAPKSSQNLIKAFELHSDVSRLGCSSKSSSPFDMCTYNDLLHIYGYLCVSDVLKCACVASKWHRVSENPAVWVRLGIRRWELALQSSLGFIPSTTSSFYKPPLSNKSSKCSSARSSIAETKNTSKK